MADKVSMPTERALRHAETEGLKLAFHLRLAVTLFLVLVLLLAMEKEATFKLGTAALLWGVLGGVHYLIGASAFGRGWAGYVVATLDALLIVGASVLLLPMVAPAWPEQMVFRFGAVNALVVLLAVHGLSASPTLMIWTGTVSLVAWAGGLAWVLALPTTLSALTDRTLTAGASASDLAALFLDAQYVPTAPRLVELAAIVVLAGALATAARRSRRLLRQEVALTRARSHLSRHLSPMDADAAAERLVPLGAPRDIDAGILVATLDWCRRNAGPRDPAALMETLRAFRARVELCVFEREGALVGHLGDGATAAFGALAKGAHDAADTLASARALLAEADRWNSERKAADEAPLELFLGVHFGPGVSGDMGREGMPALAVVGENVRVARGLEALARSLDCRLVVSDAVLRAVRVELGGEADALLAGLSARGVHRLAGREMSVAVWTL